jgi:hypothetical protein
MSMFLDIFAALLAWGAAAAWVLTGGDKFPPDWGRLWTGKCYQKLLHLVLLLLRSRGSDQKLSSFAPTKFPMRNATRASCDVSRFFCDLLATPMGLLM